MLVEWALPISPYRYRQTLVAGSDSDRAGSVGEVRRHHGRLITFGPALPAMRCKLH